jgi:uncharacterized membrane protein
MPNTLIKTFILSYDVYRNRLNKKPEFLPDFNMWKIIYRHIMVKKAKCYCLLT